MTALTLTSLPGEVLGLIAEKLLSKSDLCSLCRVSRAAYNYVLPLLYRELVVLVDHNRGFNIDDTAFLKNPDHLKHVRTLEFRARQLLGLSGMCYRSRPYTEFGYISYVELNDLVKSLLEKAKLPNLSELKWQVGRCAPSVLVGAENQLVQDFSQVQSLALATDPRCEYIPHEGMASIDLSKFDRLKAFSWAKPSEEKHLVQLVGCLRTNNTNLRELNIELCGWLRDAELLWERKELFNTQLIACQHGTDTAFPSLRSLRLRGISFETRAKELVRAFNFGSLQKLKLLGCNFVNKIYQAIQDLQIELKLNHFEYLYEGRPLTDDVGRAKDKGDIGEVCEDMGDLGYVGAVQDLFISQDYFDGDVPQPATYILAKCRESVKRLVLHERYSSDEFMPSFDYFRYMKWNKALRKVVSLPGLECLALTRTEHYMMLDHFSRLKTKPAFKLFHIRVSGTKKEHMLAYKPVSDRSSTLARYRVPCRGSLFPELENFANWAFGPEGLPHLQAVAYGDFSCIGHNEGKHSDLLTQKVLCRANPADDSNDGPFINSAADGSGEGLLGTAQSGLSNNSKHDSELGQNRPSTGARPEQRFLDVEASEEASDEESDSGEEDSEEDSGEEDSGEETSEGEYSGLEYSEEEYSEDEVSTDEHPGQEDATDEDHAHTEEDLFDYDDPHGYDLMSPSDQEAFDENQDAFYGMLMETDPLWDVHRIYPEDDDLYKDTKRYFRELSSEDHDIHELIERNRDFLSACPLDEDLQ